MFGLGPMEVGVIVLALVLIFGPRQIPKLGRALGETVKSIRGIGAELHDSDDEEDT